MAIEWMFLDIGLPQVTMVVSIPSHGLMTWMIWGSPILGNPHMKIAIPPTIQWGVNSDWTTRWGKPVQFTQS
jgi:hypothetical protein